MQDTASVLAMRFHDGRWRITTYLADRVRPLGFDPATASQVSRVVPMRPANLRWGLRLRRIGTTETSPVTDLVTDLVTAHTSPDMTTARKQMLAGR
jgi:hypothetical protein